ncbi:MAG: ATP-dependent helicase, partial [Thermoplasmata archaeon]
MVLVLRALNLLLFHDVKPSEILVCTFTEKAAATLKDRITRALRDVGKEMDLTELSVGTVHSICNSLIEEFLDSTHLNRGYEVLNDLTQILFLHEHYYQIIRHPDPLARAHWPSIEVAAEYFNRITEECVDPEDLAQSEDEYLERIATLYKRYEDELREANSVDFAHLQSIVLELLRDSESGPKLKERFRYVMVDEYQDTNYIQERLFLELVKDTSNLCVVGDEDQSLYRFRGATVQNILQFPNHFDEISLVNLGTNYRSTPGIIEFVSNFIHDGTWTDATGKEYRYDKPLEAFRPSLDNSVPSVYVTNEPEPREVARFIKRILQSNAVSDLNQIAILLRSVKRDGPAFFRALEAESVPYYAPRAQRFMQLPIVRLVIGTLIETLSYDVQDCWNDELRDFYDECKSMLLSDGSNELMDSIAQESQAINALEVGGSLKKGIVDLFYEALGKEPFLSGLRDEVGARCIAMLTDYLTKFQEYYRLPVIRENTIKKIRRNLFNSYLYVL